MGRAERDWVKEQRRQPLLAFVESREETFHPEREEPSVTLVLDAIREEDVPGLEQRVEARPPTSTQIVLTYTGEAARSGEAALQESTWITAQFEEEGTAATAFEGLDDASASAARVSIGPPLDRNRSAAMRRLFSLERPDALEEELRSALDVGPADFIAVYKVGQGNCNAACLMDGHPLLYFDFGGGCLANAKTYPPALRFCHRGEAPVVLSHWDFDHWFSARRHPEILGHPWIVPRQSMGPTALAFARTLKRILVWPDGLHSLETRTGTFVRCGGGSVNDSGLAAIFGVGGTARRGYVVCPGDARYADVPRLDELDAPLEGLVASHHGSRHVLAGMPTPGLGARLAYSFGTGNHYHHPSSHARAAYQDRGWNVSYETPAGHIGLGGTSHGSPCASGCVVGVTQP